MNHREEGFTIVEILFALLIFSIVAVGTLGFLGAATSGGLLDALPTSFATTRAARDYTAAATYLQSLQEFAAKQGFSAATVGTYTVNGPAAGTTCSGSLSGVPWTGAPCPENQPYQLKWKTLDVVIEQWYWTDNNTPLDNTDDKYCPNGSSNIIPSPGCSAAVSTGSIKVVQSTLTWIYRESGNPRTLRVTRFLCSAPTSNSWCQ